MATPLARGLPANFAAPYNCTIASVILPVAVSLALSSDCCKISPRIDCSTLLVNFVTALFSTSSHS